MASTCRWRCAVYAWFGIWYGSEERVCSCGEGARRVGFRPCAARWRAWAYSCMQIDSERPSLHY